MTDGAQRHGCLTATLVFMFIANSAVTLLYTIGSDQVKRGLPDDAEWAIPVLAIMGVFNLVCAVALWKWKKWGFYGFAASAFIALIINLSIGLSPANAFMGLLGIPLLYWVLNMGKAEKAWPRLQ